MKSNKNLIRLILIISTILVTFVCNAQNQADTYYHALLLSSYSVRYNLFILVVVCTGVISIIVPFVMR